MAVTGGQLVRLDGRLNGFRGHVARDEVKRVPVEETNVVPDERRHVVASEPTKVVTGEG